MWLDLGWGLLRIFLGPLEWSGCGILFSRWACKWAMWFGLELGLGPYCLKESKWVFKERMDQWGPSWEVPHGGGRP